MLIIYLLSYTDGKGNCGSQPPSTTYYYEQVCYGCAYSTVEDFISTSK